MIPRVILNKELTSNITDVKQIPLFNSLLNTPFVVVDDKNRSDVFLFLPEQKLKITHKFHKIDAMWYINSETQTLTIENDGEENNLLPIYFSKEIIVFQEQQFYFFFVFGSYYNDGTIKGIADIYNILHIDIKRKSKQKVHKETSCEKKPLGKELTFKKKKYCTIFGKRYEVKKSNSKCSKGSFNRWARRRNNDCNSIFNIFCVFSRRNLIREKTG